MRVLSLIVYTQMWLTQYLGPHMSLGFGTKILFDMEVANQLVPMHAHSASIALGQFLFQTRTVRVPAGFDGTLQFPYSACSGRLSTLLFGRHVTPSQTRVNSTT